MTRTIMVSANTGWNLVNFRSAVIREAVSRGLKVVAVVPPDPVADAALAAMGAIVEPVFLDSVGLSPTRDLRTLTQLVQLMRHYRPSHYCSWTPKPNVYGSLAARVTGVRVVLNISGLGSVFIADSMLTRAIKVLYRFAFRQARTIFFQNTTDRDLFLRARLVRPDQAVVLPGSGIDLDHFLPSSSPERANGELTFLFVARLLRDKGIEEYVAAARRLRAAGLPARFQVLGAIGAANRTAIAREQLDRWISEGDIEYLGLADDVRPLIAAADCVVLPSYREGTARVLLEAGAMAKPVVATDVPGCRDPVEHGRTGLLCEVRSAEALAATMLEMARMPAAQRRAMGEAGRARVEAVYDHRIVVARYMAAIDA